MAIEWVGPFYVTMPEQQSGPWFAYHAYDTLDSNYATHYQLIGGADAGLFTFENEVLAIKPEFLENYLGYESGKHTFELTFRATHAWFDWGSNSWIETEGVATYTVEITDVGPYATPGAQYGSFQISEDSEAGDAVTWYYGGIGPLVLDGWNFSDGTGPATLTLSDDAGGRFYLDKIGDQYHVKVADGSLLNQETGTSFEIAIDITDGTTTVTQTYGIILRNVAPQGLINTGDANPTIDENASVGTLVGIDAFAEDPHGGPVTYGFASGNWRSAAFDIDPLTGVVTVKDSTLLNFEDWASIGLTIEAKDSGGAYSTMDVVVTLNDVNDAPKIWGYDASFAVEEGELEVADFNVTDEDGDTVTLSLGGADGALFDIDEDGVITFKAAPDFESKIDADHDGVYDVTLIADDGESQTTRDLQVTVTNVNDPAVFVGGPSIAIEVDEGISGNTVLHHVEATDPDGDDLTYGITGIDTFFTFEIDANGDISFIFPPNYDYPSDTGQDNVYNFKAWAYDGWVYTYQDIQVTVNPVEQAPVIQNAANRYINENWTYPVDYLAVTNPDGALTWSLIGGADAAKFSIGSSSGVLTMTAPPNFEVKADANQDNVYEVTIKVTNTAGLSDTLDMRVRVDNVNEAPVITSGAGATQTIVNVAENVKAVTTVVAADPDAGSVRTFSLLGGADKSKFAINAQTGALTFIAAPNFEAKTDADQNSIYDVVVKVADQFGLADTQTIRVNVTNVNEAPVITSGAGAVQTTVNVAENVKGVMTVVAADPDAGSVRTFSLAGGADQARFAINAQTGALSFIAAPNFEAKADADKNNLYDVVVRVADQFGLSDTQTIRVNVTDVNEGAPVITSNGGGATALITIKENLRPVTVVTATDVDIGKPRTYSLGNTVDKADFVINSTTGALSFVTAPDFEKPADSNKDNVYAVIVVASDGTSVDTQTITIRVLNDDGKPVTGTNVAETLTGTASEELVSGLAGNDILRAQAGADRIVGGLGADDLYGGIDEARDTFVFLKGDSGNTPATWDQIFNFVRGQDVIDLSGIDGDTLPGVQHLRFVTAFTSNPNSDGQFRVVRSGADMLVQIDTDGNNVADMVLQVMGVTTLSAADFVY